MFNIISPVSAAETATSTFQFQGELTWVFPVLATVVLNIAALAYFLGGIRPEMGGIRLQIDSLSGRIDKLEDESEKAQIARGRVDDRVHSMAVSLGKIEVMMSNLATAINKTDCQCNRRRRVEEESAS